MGRGDRRRGGEYGPVPERRRPRRGDPAALRARRGTRARRLLRSDLRGALPADLDGAGGPLPLRRRAPPRAAGGEPRGLSRVHRPRLRDPGGDPDRPAGPGGGSGGGDHGPRPRRPRPLLEPPRRDQADLHAGGGRRAVARGDLRRPRWAAVRAHRCRALDHVRPRADGGAGEPRARGHPPARAQPAALGAQRERDPEEPLCDPRMDRAGGLEGLRAGHERGTQRLFGISLALGSDVPLADEDRRRCAAEIKAALGDLREALIGSRTGSVLELQEGSLRAELDRLGRQYKDLPLTVEWSEGVDIPRRLEPLAVSVLNEALRNAEKHADPSEVKVSIADP